MLDVVFIPPSRKVSSLDVPGTGRVQVHSRAPPPAFPTSEREDGCGKIEQSHKVFMPLVKEHK